MSVMNDSKSGVGAAIAAVLLVVIAYSVYAATTPEGRQQAQARAAIQQCRLAQHDPHASVHDRLATRETCDWLIADYHARWSAD